MNQVNKESLTPPQKRLIELMQDINFGFITDILVRDGEPEITSETVIMREFKLGGLNGSRPERGREDFVLKQSVVELFEQLTLLCNGNIHKLEIKHGLPFSISIEGHAN